MSTTSSLNIFSHFYTKHKFSLNQKALLMEIHIHNKSPQSSIGHINTNHATKQSHATELAVLTYAEE